MSKTPQIIIDDDISFGKLDTAVKWLLISLLSFMPFAFGVVHAWSEEVVIIFSGAIVICFLLKTIIYKNQRIIWAWAYIPLMAFLILVVIQLIPLPASLVSALSGNTAGLKKELLGDLPDSDKFLSSMTFSFYPFATKHDLRLILALGGVFFVVLNEFRQPEKIQLLLKAIAIIGAIIAVIALGQNLFGNGKIYWFINNRNSNSYSGPFVNHSHYGQFMNLSIGAALGLLFVKLHEIFHERKISLPVILDYLSSYSSITIWLLIVMIGISMATVFISLSRGGIVSMLLATSIITLIISSKQRLRSHSWIMVGTALVAFICVLYIGFDAVYERLATLRHLNETGQNRLQMLKDTTIAWSKFPLLGTGLGTYSVVYPMFDDSHITALATHAENEYAQAAEETGMIGLGLLVVFGIIAGICFLRNIRRTNRPIQSASYGLGFGLIAILIHSFGDFGQHLPANGFLSAVFCALLISMSRYSAKNASGLINTLPLKNRFAGLAALLLVSVIFAWSLFGANNSRLAEAHRKEARAIESNLIKTSWKASDAVYTELISHASDAAAYEPDNINNLYLLDVYRWRSINHSDSPDISKTLISDSSISIIRDIDNHLNIARRFCPTYGPVYTLSGQIEKFVLNDESGSDKIKKGYLLAPCNPIACFVAGYLDICEGQYDDCFAKLNRAVQLKASFYRDVVRIYVEDLSRPYKAISLAGNNVDRLKHLVNVFNDAQYNDLAQQCRIKVKELLEQKCRSATANASDNASLAGIYKQLNENEYAIEHYRRALALDYSQIAWRIELARLLAQTGNIAEAMSQVRICLRINPNSKEAENLLADLSISPAGWSRETQSH